MLLAGCCSPVALLRFARATALPFDGRRLVELAATSGVVGGAGGAGAGWRGGKDGAPASSGTRAVGFPGDVDCPRTAVCMLRAGRVWFPDRALPSSLL